MSSDASTLPLRDTAEDERTGSRARRSPAAVLARFSAAQWLALASLVAIAVGCAFIVVIAANRPSILSPTTHTNFFPGWMAGPAGGLWPGLTRNTTALRCLFSGSIVVMFVAYLIAVAHAPKLSARWTVAAIVTVHAIMLLAPPLALTDIFNYVNYGHMEVVHHLNPYTTIPILEPHNDPSYALSNWHQLLSPYGPLFTLFTFAFVPLGVPASFWVLKAFLALSSLAMLALVWRCARLVGRDPVAAVALVGLNPIVLVWGLGGDHNDSLTLLVIMVGFYLLLRSRDEALEREAARRAPWLGGLSPRLVGAGCAFVTAAAMKASAGVLLPVVIASLLRSRRRLAALLLGMALAGAAVAVASLIAFGLHIPDLSTQARLVTNVSVPNLIGLALGSGGESETLHVVLGAVLLALVAACCVQAWRRGSAITASGWASVALLVTLSWVLPWYVLWVLPLAALSSSRRLRAASAALGVYLIIAWAPASALLWDVLHFHPEKTSLGRLHQRYVRELLN